MKIHGFQKIILILLSFSHSAFSQMAKVNGIIKNAHNGKLIVIRPAFPFSYNNIYLGSQEIKLNNTGEFNLMFDLEEPEMMNASLEDSAGRHVANYNFYLSPGDDLKMEKDEKMQPYYFKVTGKGFENNQLLQIDRNDSIQNFYGDSIPDRVISYLETNNQIHKKVLAEYISKHHPTKTFVHAWNKNLQYETLNAYYSFAANNAFNEAYERNYNKWNKITTSLFLNAPLVNENALDAAAYKEFLSTFLLRFRGGLWRQFEDNRSNFLTEWYGNDTAAGVELFLEDKHNELGKKIIEKFFTGRVKEYAYAVLISGAINESDIKNLTDVYQQFKLQFPFSSY